jgi:pyruvate dehydrogenase E1 component alpha subunit
VAVKTNGAPAAGPDPLGLAGQPGTGELVQLLTPEGERTDHPDFPLEVSAEELRALYRDLALVRRIDFEAIALQRQGELGIWASLLGQEAAQIGSGRALQPRDMAFPTYREHGVAWCRGLDPVKLLGLFRGVSHGGWDPRAHNFHLYTIVIGSQTLHATGYAMGISGTARWAERRAVIRLLQRHDQPGRRQRGVHLGVGDQRPDRVLLPEQPVGDLEPLEQENRVPLTSGLGFGTPACGWTATTCWLPGRYPQGHAGGQGRAGPD